jgi:hypothetical protein
MKKHLNLRNLLLVLLLFLVSCTPKAQLIGVWADDSFSGYKINDVLVIGISRDHNVQKLWEDVFTIHLNQEKVNAMASYATVGGTIKPERKSVEAAIRKSGAKTVLISRVIDATTESQSTLGRRASSLGIYGFYDLSLSSTYVPSTTLTKKVVRVETNFYDVATEKLVWTGQAEVVNPEMTRADFDSVAGLLIEGLKYKNLL